jgi:DNA-binding XRE family transcriptional regulator
MKCFKKVINLAIANEYITRNPFVGIKFHEVPVNKEFLTMKGIKQTWLAEKLGKSFKMVNAYACNRKQPSLETLFQIAELLDISVKDLIVDNK